MATLRVLPEAQAKVSAAGSRKGLSGRRASETLKESVTRPPAPRVGVSHPNTHGPRTQST